MEELVLFYPDRHELHFERGHPERPERVEAIRNALEDSGLWESLEKMPPIEIPKKVLQAVHDESYLEEISSASKNGLRPDMDTYLTPYSWELALNSAGGALAVSEAVWKREANRGYALCRPPGHHATPDQAMGFCILNNSSIATENILQKFGAKRIAIIDLDVHHGNGTQDIFWERSDVLFISVHQSPLYPGTGSAKEIGAGDGEGFTINIPLPPYSGNEARLHAMEEIILPKLSEFKPEMIMVSVGFDAHWKDPLAQQLTSADNYGKLISLLSKYTDQYTGGRLAIFLEGGDDLHAGAACSLAITNALLGKAWKDTLGESQNPETNEWRTVLNHIKVQWGIN